MELKIPYLPKFFPGTDGFSSPFFLHETGAQCSVLALTQIAPMYPSASGHSLLFSSLEALLPRNFFISRRKEAVCRGNSCRLLLA